MATRVTNVPITESRRNVRREVDEYGREPESYDVWQSRRSPRVEGRRIYANEAVRDRDYLTSYGGVVGQRGGLGGINYEHDISEAAPGYYDSVREVRSTRQEYPVRREIVTEREYDEEYSPEYTTSYVSRSAVPSSYSSYDEYDEYDFPSYEYGQASTSYIGATSAIDYIDERRGKSGRRKWNPICDMGETPSYWLIRCEIPGVRKDRLKVEVEGKDLVIKGKRVKELWNLDRLGPAPTAAAPSAPATGASSTTPANAVQQKFTADPRMSAVTWLNKERGGKGTFKRRVRLPERVDNSAIQALYKDGILEVLVKKPEAQARKQVKAQAKTVQIQHS